MLRPFRSALNMRNKLHEQIAESDLYMSADISTEKQVEITLNKVTQSLSYT